MPLDKSNTKSLFANKVPPDNLARIYKEPMVTGLCKSQPMTISPLQVLDKKRKKKIRMQV